MLDNFFFLVAWPYGRGLCRVIELHIRKRRPFLFIISHVPSLDIPISMKMSIYNFRSSKLHNLLGRFSDFEFERIWQAYSSITFDFCAAKFPRNHGATISTSAAIFKQNWIFGEQMKKKGR